MRITPDALRQVRRGHPWVYDASITSVSAPGAAGDLAVVFDADRRFAAIGLWDPHSPIRLKVLHTGGPTPIDDGWWRDRIRAAVDRRAGLAASSGSERTTAYRVIHGENDGLPGLVVDRYGAALVVKVYSAAWFPHLDSVVPLLVEELAATTVVLRLARTVAQHAPVRFGDGATLVGEAPAAPVRFLENGLAFEADLLRGQKTGHFLDQRENRALVRSMAAGRRVLDVFCCTGGFSVNAAAGGARLVHGIDLAAPAVAAARRNMAHNAAVPAVAACRHRTTVGDAFEVLERLAREGERYDLVVLDPPPFARRQGEVHRARRAYERLASLGAALLEPGGLLVQASCSSRVTGDDFFDAVHRGAAAAGVGLVEVTRTGHALDHPIGFAQGGYLDALFARVSVSRVSVSAPSAVRSPSRRSRRGT